MNFFNCHQSRSQALIRPIVYHHLTLSTDSPLRTHGVAELSPADRAALHRLAALTDEFLAQDRIPDAEALALAANMPAERVKQLLRLLDFEPASHPLRLKTDQLLLALYRTGMKGNVTSIKLWLQLFEIQKPTALPDVQDPGLPILDVIAEVQQEQQAQQVEANKTKPQMP